MVGITVTGGIVGDVILLMGIVFSFSEDNVSKALDFRLPALL